MKRIILIVGVVLVLGGCGEQVRANGTSENNIVIISEYGTYELWRVVDKEAGVVCWIRPSTGLDCLPLSETKLDK